MYPSNFQITVRQCRKFYTFHPFGQQTSINFPLSSIHGPFARIHSTQFLLWKRIWGIPRRYTRHFILFAGRALKDSNLTLSKN